MKTESTFIKIVALTTVLVCFGISKVVAQTGGFANVSIGGTSVTATNASQLLDYISRSGQYTIHVDGTIYLSGMNKVASNKAILGVGTTARIVGGGLNIDGVSNVVVQNISFSDWDDDAINLQDGSTNIWIDHCSFTNGDDGCVDIKRGSDYVTVSWNHFYNHRKTCLLGHSDNNASQDSGHLRVTYHHNYFDGTYSRHPRVRFSALTHVYNNYYRNNDYGVASTCDAEVLVEGNYFQNVDDPTLVGYGSSWDGDLEQRNNLFSGSGSPETSGSVPSPPYSYTLDNASNIPDIVPSGAGANGTTGDDDDDGAGDGVITVRARGESGTENINLKVGGSTVDSWTLSTSYRTYTYRGSATGDIQVEFDNDADGRDVQVDYIQVNGETRQAEDMSYNTALYANGACGGGGYSEWMHCNGVIGFGDVSGEETSPDPDTDPGDGDHVITIRARGIAGGEHLNVLIDNQVQADINLSTSWQEYDVQVTGGDLKLEFDNDNGDRDVQVDYIQVDGETRQAENMQYNTAVYQDGSCGGSYSDMMHCNGVIGFGDVSGNTAPEPDNIGALGCGECDWYGSLWPICCQTTGGWGWEDNMSCIGVSTCNTR